MTIDDLKDLQIAISVAIDMHDLNQLKTDPEHREPGMGTDYDCRIGEFLIKKRRNPYKGGDEY